MGVLNLIRLFWGLVSPYISLTYSLYRWGFLHFRYLNCLVNSFQMRCFNRVSPPTGNDMPRTIAPVLSGGHFFRCYVSFREGGNYIYSSKLVKCWIDFFVRLYPKKVFVCFSLFVCTICTYRHETAFFHKDRVHRSLETALKFYVLQNSLLEAVYIESVVTSENNPPLKGSGLSKMNSWYCWWTKSCTTKDDDYPIVYRVLTIPGGAGFCPSTVGNTQLDYVGLDPWVSHRKKIEKLYLLYLYVPWNGHLPYGVFVAGLTILDTFRVIFLIPHKVRHVLRNPPNYQFFFEYHSHGHSKFMSTCLMPRQVLASRDFPK